MSQRARSRHRFAPAAFALAVNALVFATIALRFVWPHNDTWTGLQFVPGLGWLEHAWIVQLLVAIAFFAFVYLVKALVEKPAPDLP